MPGIQDARRIRITTPLGADVLLVRRFDVEEQLGRLFQMNLDLLSADTSIDFDKIVGQKVTVTVDLPNGSPRYFNGFVSRFVQMEQYGRFARYRATLVPWLWFLTRRADCRIFQQTMPEPPSDMTAPGIIEKVFKDVGFSDFRKSLTQNYRALEYCVQYRETDFNFVSRLMEREGIYYYFEHAEDKHTLVLVDSINGHKKCPGYETVRYRPRSDSSIDEEVITDWVLTKEVQSSLYVLNDFDYSKPKTDLEVNAKAATAQTSVSLEIYDYPGEYLVRDDGETYAKRRIEELQARHEVARGVARFGGICTGSTFTLADHPRSDQNREYLVTGTSCRFETSEFESGEQGEESDFGSCTFTSIPSAVTYRSARTTPRPSISGVQTAIVAGPQGEQISTDDQARVKVQFHWDRLGRGDENSSCWVRVSQANAGRGWGTMITPRIGQEVIVEFLEGDPDRPIITGRVYNGDNKSPYADGKGVVSGTKSQTHKGSGYNEFSMDDTSGKEKITIHGQFDMDTTVENDQTNTVKNKFTETITSDASIKITEGDFKHDVASGKADYTVKGNMTMKSQGEVLIEATSKITLKTGASKITMEAGGDIKIEGINVTVSGTAKVETKGAMVTSQASGINTVKGSVVQVN